MFSNQWLLKHSLTLHYSLNSYKYSLISTISLANIYDLRLSHQFLFRFCPSQRPENMFKGMSEQLRMYNLAKIFQGKGERLKTLCELFFPTGIFFVLRASSTNCDCCFHSKGSLNTSMETRSLPISLTI